MTNQFFKLICLLAALFACSSFAVAERGGEETVDVYATTNEVSVLFHSIHRLVTLPVDASLTALLQSKGFYSRRCQLQHETVDHEASLASLMKEEVDVEFSVPRLFQLTCSNGHHVLLRLHRIRADSLHVHKGPSPDLLAAITQFSRDLDLGGEEEAKKKMTSKTRPSDKDLAVLVRQFLFKYWKQTKTHVSEEEIAVIMGDADANRFQNAGEDKEETTKNAATATKEYPNNLLDMSHDSLRSDYEWVKTYMLNHFGKLHPFQTYSAKQTGIFSLHTGEILQPGHARYGSADKKSTKGGVKEVQGSKEEVPRVLLDDNMEVRLATSADWGSGTYEAKCVAEAMMAGFAPHFSIHMGDVYYVSTKEEIMANCRGIAPKNTQHGVTWPSGSLGTFALMGNHEMLSRGFGYYDYWLPLLGNTPGNAAPTGQATSYFSLENKYWRVLNLDTGYHSYSKWWPGGNFNNTQPDAIIDWLINVVNITDPTDKRGIIIFTHHQYFSAFDKPHTATPQQLAKLIPHNKTVLWLWGHEHRLAFYEKGNYGNVDLQAYGRCIGVGGFPVTLGPIPNDARAARLRVYDDRVSQTLDGLKPLPVGYNGFTRLIFNANKVQLEYRSIEWISEGVYSTTNSTLLVTEEYTVDGNGFLDQTQFTVVNRNLTIVDHTPP